MSEFEYHICNYCSHKKCKAYSCNMLEDLDMELFCKIDDFVEDIMPKMVKEWRKNNKIVKENW